MSLNQALILVVLIAGTVLTVCAIFVFSMNRRIPAGNFEVKHGANDQPQAAKELEPRIVETAARGLPKPGQQQSSHLSSSTTDRSLPKPPTDYRDPRGDAAPHEGQSAAQSNHNAASWNQSIRQRYPDLWSNPADAIAAAGRPKWVPRGDVTVIDLVIQVPETRDKSRANTKLQVEGYAVQPDLPRDGFNLADFLEDYLAGKIADATWPQITDFWNPTVDPAHAEAIASGIDATKDIIHSSVVGWPVEALTSFAGLPSPVVAVAADISKASPLPIDKPFGSVATVIRVTAVVVGVAIGQPAVAIASLKSLAAHEFTSLVTHAVREVVNDVPDSTANRPEASERALINPSQVSIETDAPVANISSLLAKYDVNGTGRNRVEPAKPPPVRAAPSLRGLPDLSPEAISRSMRDAEPDPGLRTEAAEAALRERANRTQIADPGSGISF